MTFAGIFVNHHREVRSGWKLALFFILLVLLFLGIAVPFYAFGVINRSPAAEQQLPTNAILVGCILLVSWFMTRKFHRKPLTAIGLALHPGTITEAGLGLLIGFLMMTGVFIVERGLGFVEWQWHELGSGQLVWTVLASAGYFLVAAVEEELLFRGYPFQVLIQGITFLPATLLLGLLFGVAHVMNPHASTPGVINTVLMGILLAVAYMKTRGLWLPTGIHVAWNFSQTTVYGFPTSGVDFHGFQFATVIQSGPEWITGGLYGPEAGILTTVAIVAALWYMLKANYIRAQEGIVTLDSIEDLFPLIQHSGSEEGVSR